MVHVNGALVGDDHLFEQSPDDEFKAFDQLLGLDGANGLELRNEISCTFNGSGHQLREKGHERSEGNQVSGGFQALTVDVNRIA